MVAGWDISRPATDFSIHLSETFGQTTVSQPNKVEPARREKTMSRRKGQRGLIEKHGAYYTVRVRMDVPGVEKREHKRIKISPIKRGPGWLNACERERRAVEMLSEIGANSEVRFQEVVKQTRYGITFQKQAATMLDQMGMRTKPVAENTFMLWRNLIRRWLNPLIGDLMLTDVNNGALKQVAIRLKSNGLSPLDEMAMRKNGKSDAEIRSSAKPPIATATIVQILLIAKAVVGSAVDENGDQVFPRTWNEKFIDAPKIDPNAQHTPIFSRDILNKLVSNENPTYRTLFAFLAVTGARISEVFALEIDKHISGDFRTIVIAQQRKPGKKGGVTTTLKTPASKREIDLPLAMADLLREFVGGRKEGFLFLTFRGKQMCSNCARGSYLNPALRAAGYIDPMTQRSKSGFHAFRRYRNTWLRNMTPCPEGLRKFWLGHAGRDMADRYDKIKVDRAFRLEMAEACGLGFDLPEVVPTVPRKEVSNAETECL